MDGKWFDGVKSEELETTNLHSTHVLFSRDIAGYENSVRRFWDLKVLGIPEKETPCYNHYIEDIRKNSENTYEVSLSFKENHPLIHDHFELSKKRLRIFTKDLKTIRNSWSSMAMYLKNSWKQKLLRK